MQPLADLIDPNDTGAEAVRDLLAHAENPVEVFRSDRARGERALQRVQAPTSTLLGAVALRLGGLASSALLDESRDAEKCFAIASGDVGARGRGERVHRGDSPERLRAHGILRKPVELPLSEDAGDALKGARWHKRWGAEASTQRPFDWPHACSPCAI